MKQVFTGELISYGNNVNVVDEIVQDFPRTLSLAIGAGLMWMFFAVMLGLYTRGEGGALRRPLLNRARAHRRLDARVLGRRDDGYYLGFKWGIFPNGGYVPITRGARCSGPIT